MKSNIQLSAVKNWRQLKPEMETLSKTKCRRIELSTLNYTPKVPIFHGTNMPNLIDHIEKNIIQKRPNFISVKKLHVLIKKHIKLIKRNPLKTTKKNEAQIEPLGPLRDKERLMVE